MFETLTERLSAAFSGLRGGAELTEENIEEGLRAVRAALLEADVHFQVARDFAERVRARVVGASAMRGRRGLRSSSCTPATTSWSS